MQVEETTFMLTAKQSLLPILLVCLTACLFGCGQQDNSRTMETREFAIDGMSCEGCIDGHIGIEGGPRRQIGRGVVEGQESHRGGRQGVVTNN